MDARLSQILTYRGYKYITKPIFTSRYMYIHAINSTRGQPTEVHCYILTDRTYRCGKKDIQYILDSKHIDHVILVTGSLSSQGVHLFTKSVKYYEVLSHNDIMLPVLEHKFVPQYRIMTELEKEACAKKYGEISNHNKIIATYDIIARILDLRPGDLVQTKQLSNHIGVEIAYRYVISPDCLP
jgi:DNA-directed RNA polymerase subunit H (RpoH/RPB5)